MVGTESLDHGDNYKLDSLNNNWYISEEVYFRDYIEFTIPIEKGCYLLSFIHGSGSTHNAYFLINNIKNPVLVALLVSDVFTVTTDGYSLKFKYNLGGSFHTTGRIRYIKF